MERDVQPYEMSVTMTWQHTKSLSQEAASARARVLAAARTGRANTKAVEKKARANILRYANVVGVAWVEELRLVRLRVSVEMCHPFIILTEVIGWTKS